MLAELAHEPYAAVSETHSAAVFFAGDRAYKLKKPVSLGFLDFSTPEARAAACQCETVPTLHGSPRITVPARRPSLTVQQLTSSSCTARHRPSWPRTG